jgi:tungstate transport system ATP-binding protein
VTAAVREAALGWRLERVGLGALPDHPARRLSGGEQQRTRPRACPTIGWCSFWNRPAGRDPAASKAAEEIVGAAAAGGVKIVTATHDLAQARRLAGDINVLVASLLVERATAARFFASPGAPS